MSACKIHFYPEFYPYLHTVFTVSLPDPHDIQFQIRSGSDNNCLPHWPHRPLLLSNLICYHLSIFYPSLCPGQGERPSVVPTICTPITDQPTHGEYRLDLSMEADRGHCGEARPQPTTGTGTTSAAVLALSGLPLLVWHAGLGGG